MRKNIALAVLALVLMVAPLGIVAASDVTGALYKLIITVGNTSTAATNVATVCTLSTPNLVTGGYANSSANNIALRSSTGADVPFMPGYSTNPMVLFVPSIGGTSYVQDLLYTATSTGSKIRYFPSINGMTVADNAALEPASNFDMRVAGFVDLTAINKYIITKQESFALKVTGADNITAGVPTKTYTSAVTSTGATWLTEAQAYDGNTGTQASYNFGAPGWSPYLTLSFASTPTAWAGWYVYVNSANVNLMELDVYYSGAWVNVFTGVPVTGSWQESALFTSYMEDKDVIAMRVRFSATVGVGDNCGVKEIRLGYNNLSPVVRASGLTSSEMAVKITADGANLKLYVNDVLKDTVAIGAGVTNNANLWYFFLGNSMPYVEYASITVGGTPISYWDWEYGATFTDNISSIVATPTFRTSTSVGAVTASAGAFSIIDPAEASASALATPSDFYHTPTITGTFTTGTVTPTYPGADVITAIAAASGTPSNLPFTIITGVVILILSLSVSALMRRGGSGSLIIKMVLIVGLLGVAVALQVFDLWMPIVFLLLAAALAMGSQQRGWN
jgi:hypothetical protein